MRRKIFRLYKIVWPRLKKTWRRQVWLVIRRANIA